MSMRVEDVSLVHFEVGGLMLVGGGQGRVRSSHPSWRGQPCSGLGPCRVEGPAREVGGVVNELGKGFGESLVICLLHSGKEGGAEAQDKAHRCG